MAGNTDAHRQLRSANDELIELRAENDRLRTELQDLNAEKHRISQTISFYRENDLPSFEANMDQGEIILYLAAKLDEFQEKYKEAKAREDFLEETTKSLLDDFNGKLPKLKELKVYREKFANSQKEITEKDERIRMLEVEVSRVKGQYADELNRNFRLETGSEPRNPIRVTEIELVEAKYKKYADSLKKNFNAVKADLEHRVEELSLSNQELLRKYTDAEAERAEVVNKFQTSEGLQRFYEASLSEHKRLQAELDQAKYLIESQAIEHRALNQEFQRQLNEVKELRLARANTENQLRTTTLQLNSATESYKKLEAEAKNTADMLALQLTTSVDLSDYNKGLLSRVDDLEKINAELTEALAKDNYEPLKQQLELMNSEKLDLADQYHKMATSVQAENRRIVTESEEVRAENERLKQALSQVPEETWTYASEIESLRTINSSLERQLTELREAKSTDDTAQVSQIVPSQEFNESLQMRVNELESYCQGIKTERHQLALLLQENIWLSEQLDKLIEELNSSRIESESYQDNLKSYIEQNTELHRKLEESENKILSQTSELRTLVSNIEVDHRHSTSEAASQAEDFSLSTLSCLRSSVGELDQFVRTLVENSELRTRICELESKLNTAESTANAQLPKLVMLTARALTLLSKRPLS